MRVFAARLLHGPMEPQDEADPMDYFVAGGQRRQGGRGTARPNRAAPRYYEEGSADGAIAPRRVRDFTLAPWWRRHLSIPPRFGSLAWDEFRVRFRVPWPLLDPS